MSGPESFAVIIDEHGREREVPFQGGVVRAQAFFKSLGYSVVRTWWMKRNWSR